MRYTLVLVILFSALSLRAQTGDEMLDLAKQSLNEKDAASAQTQASAAIKAFEKEKNLSGWIKAQRVSAKASIETGQDLYEVLLLVEKVVSNPFTKPTTDQEFHDFCKFLLYKAELTKKFGDFVKVKKDLEEARRIFKQKIGEKDPIVAAFLYRELGNAYVRLTEYAGAERIFEENLKYAALHPKTAMFNDYGNLFLNLNLYERAIEIFQQGLAFNEAQAPDNRLPQAEVKLLYLNIAEALAHLSRFTEALEMNKKAEHAHLSPDDQRYERCQFGLYENYGIIYLGMARAGDQRKFPLALDWFKKARDAAEDADTREKAGFEINVAEVWLAWGKPDEALQGYQAALQLLLPKIATGKLAVPKSNELFAEKKLILALLGKANAFRALGQLEKALECYELIPIVEAKLRATHAYESSSLLALKESRQRFHEAVDLAWQLFERSNGNPDYAKRAFRLTELARGIILLQSLAQARQFLPQDIRERDYDIRVRIAWLDHAIAAEREKGTAADSKKLSEWERQRFDLKLECQNLLANFPAYNSPDSLVLQVLAAADVRKLLRPEQIMVDYFLTPTSAYVFSFNHGGEIRWRKSTLPSQFREQTQQMATYLWSNKTTGKDVFLRHAWTLDSLLIMPELAKWGMAIKSLVIVPDDVLTLVPFEALIRRPSPGGTWREQPWLLKDFNMAYAYSATLLDVQKSISAENARATKKPKTVYGGFAPSYAQSNRYQLQNTAPMVNNVCKMLGGETWEGTKASEEQFKKSAPNYRILLLAMHGISDNVQPELSRLIFGDSLSNSPINNNILYAPELQIMRLQADLAVLSACHSGAGKLEQGEGVYSLARAFAASGVPATVMSLWLLHENTAPPLIEAFFRHLKQGKTKDEALRLAKLDYLNNDENFELNHPFYWAGLAASGDMRALDLRQPKSFPWSWVLVFSVAVFAVWWFWKRVR